MRSSLRIGIPCGTAVLSVVAAALVVLPAAAAPAPSPGGVTIRVLPADPADLTPRTLFAFPLKAGQSATGAFEVGNTTRTTVHLAVAPVNGLTGATSGVVYGDRSLPRRGAARWIRLSAGQLVLAPGATATVGLTVHAPTTAKVGDSVAGIVVQNTRKVASNGVTLIVRAVVSVAVTVPGRAAFTPRISAATIKRVVGLTSSNVVVRIGNRGRRAAGPKLAVTVTGAGRRTTVTRQLDTILPGSTIAFPLTWPKRLKVGTYRVSVLLQHLRHTYTVRYR